MKKRLWSLRRGTSNAPDAQQTFEQKRQLIDLFIDRVVVTGEEVEIRYVIPTSSKGETARFCHLR